ncbi:Tn3 family transposase [Streptomyces sp. NPDC058486]|uniref:Tn3 family transposase n=1 Tax=unclassified Streptomyces TaxID=2593676 RepID=UPI0036652B55
MIRTVQPRRHRRHRPHRAGEGDEVQGIRLLTNAVIFLNALDIAEIVRQLLEEGWEIGPEDLAHISPY